MTFLIKNSVLSDYILAMTLFALEPSKLYSIAFIPNDEFNALIKSIKRMLFERFGWYPSCNSDGHITLSKFEATAESLNQWEKFIETFCRKRIPFEIHFNKTGVFPEIGTFYLDPDSKSKITAIDFMRDFHMASKQFGPSKKVVLPHLSIARRGFTPEQIEIAKNLIEPIDLRFICDSICIRRFDEQKQQYELYKRIRFSGL